MLFDPKWNETKPLTAEGELLLAAADYLENHGWCQGKLTEPNGAACAIGAMHCGIGALRFGERPDTDKGLRISETITGFSLYLAKQTGNGRIADWNDAPGRTKEQVVSMLREAAYAV